MPPAPPPPNIFCPRCGYSLVALPTPRCPECGRPFDPPNPPTYLSHPPRRLPKYPLRPTLASLLLAILFASPIAWLWWGWKREQPAIAALSPTGTLRTRVLEIPLYSKLLGRRYSYLFERADLYSLTTAHTAPNIAAHVRQF